MKLMHLLFAATLLGSVACQTERTETVVPTPTSLPEKATEPAHTDGKPEAPVAIGVMFEGNVAHVRVTFSQAGSGVRVRAAGVRGLALKGDGVLVDGLTVSGTESLSYEVSFGADAPAGSLLAIDVRGQFAAGERASVRTFPVGPVGEPAKKPTTTVGGEKVRVLPAVEQQH